MEIKLHLDAQDFNDTPTKTQLTNLLGDLINFQNRVAGALQAKGEYTIADEALGVWLNALIQMQRAKDLFDGKNLAGMPTPQPQGPRAVPGR